jgi:hypothetical protein
MTVAASQPPRLGEVLIAYGVVTPQQLEVALAEQRESGRPIGEIIVEKGYAPGPMVAQALATQKGGLVKTEYGFATGFQASVRPDAPDVGQDEVHAHEIARLQQALAARDGEIERLRGLVEQLRAAVDLGRLPAPG